MEIQAKTERQTGLYALIEEIEHDFIVEVNKVP